MKSFIISTIFLAMLLFTGSCKEEPINPPTNPVNRKPMANAGKDTTIWLPANQAQLNGSNSFDPDNNIRSYHWTKQSGPDSFIIVNPNAAVTDITGLVKGVYEFQLTVTDVKGEISTDICLAYVNLQAPPPPPPPPPPAPGTFFWISTNPHDTVLNLPANTVTLNASTWSNINQPIHLAIANIEWRKVAGPNNYTIQLPHTLSTAISGLSDGLYAFQCKITDSSGWSNVSYGDVINVTDTTSPGQEIIVPDQTWYGTLGDCNYVQFNLAPYIPANKSIKKIFVKQDCDSVFRPVYYYSTAPANYPYVYQFDFGINGGFSLIVYECTTFSCLDPNNKPDIKIVY
jgi:hypothetical protein